MTSFPSTMVIAIMFGLPPMRAFLAHRSHHGFFSRMPNICKNLDFGIKVRSSASDFNTAYEWLERRHDPPISNFVEWVDPNRIPCSSPPSRKIGFDIGTPKDSDELNKKQLNNVVRLPIYPLPAVYLPSSALQTLNNVQTKNIRMAKDLKVGKWNFLLNEVDEKYDNIQTDGGYFVAALRAQDTGRIATIGSLMQVIALEENYAMDKRTLTRIVVTCQTVGIVELQGVEKETSEDDYRIGHVKILEANNFVKKNSHDDCGNARDMPSTSAESSRSNDALEGIYQHTKIDDTKIYLDECIIHRIVEDYSKVRSLYIDPTNGVASRELPAFAKDTLVDNLPSFTQEDFTSKKNFWNVVECWQMLCNTVREAHRSKLMTQLNEIMIKAACEKGGPLELPIKRYELPNNVQAKLIQLEKEANEDFLSLGMDPCLDFQVLLGMSARNNKSETSDFIYAKRVAFLGNMIRKEKDRLEAKEKLKTIFKSGSKHNETSDNSFQ